MFNYKNSFYLLLIGLLLVLPNELSAAVLIDCTSSQPGGDWNYRGFYIPNYPGIDIESATLNFRASSAGTYDITLTVREDTYDGNIIGTDTASVSLDSASFTQVTFDFPYPAIAKGSTVTFAITSSPSNVYYDITSVCTEVIETQGTEPPLDTFRGTGVTLQVTGTENNYVWPGPAPCDGTLQECIDAIGSGNTIEIATNTVDESLNFDKSLTLKPASGYSPRFINTHSIVASSSGSTDNAITIKGLTMETGIFIITHSSTGTFTLNLLNNTIEEGFTTNPAIRIWPIDGGKTFFNIVGNTMTVPYSEYNQQMHGIQIHSQSDIEGSISNNKVVIMSASQGNAVELTNMKGVADVDMIGNKIYGTNMNNGIFVYQYGTQCTSNTRIINNLVTGQVGNVGGPGAITYYISDGLVSLDIINNTVADNEEGIMLYCDAGTTSGKVANNIIANNTERGLYIDSAVAATVSNNNNLLYNNSSNGFTPGPGTIYADPLFVGPHNYRPQASSPAVNSGDNAALPGSIQKDLDGKLRIAGAAVDIGAYEWYSGIAPIFLLLLLH